MVKSSDLYIKYSAFTDAVYFIHTRIHLPLTEGVQAGQDLGDLVAVQTYAADQELFVNLAHHRAGKSGAVTGHPNALA